MLAKADPSATRAARANRTTMVRESSRFIRGGSFLFFLIWLAEGGSVGRFATRRRAAIRSGSCAPEAAGCPRGHPLPNRHRRRSLGPRRKVLREDRPPGSAWTWDSVA